MRVRWAGPVAAAFLVLPAWSGGVVAQERPAEAVLSGVLVDSLSGRPLAGATVTLGRDAGVARTDPEGRFTMRAAAGTWEVTFTHPELSNWGALRHAFTLRLEGGRTVEATLATASAATVLARTCGAGGKVLGGLVRDLLTLVPLGSASVFISARGGPGPRGQMVRTGADGGWFVCLPEGTGEVEVRASMGEVRSRPVQVAASGTVRTADLLVQVSQPAALQGVVRDGTSGSPIEGAAIAVKGSRLGTLTGADGRFTFRGVPPGSIELDVERLGYGRRTVVVRAEGGATARVTLELFAEAIATDSVVVTVDGGFVDAARTGARFDGLTRADVDRLLPRAMGVDDLLRNANIPGIVVRDVTYLRESGIEQRGLCVELARRSNSQTSPCEMVEVYLNDLRLPEPEVFLSTLSPASVDRVRVMPPGSVELQYAGTPRARNGVLLIWTRR